MNQRMSSFHFPDLYMRVRGSVLFLNCMEKWSGFDCIRFLLLAELNSLGNAMGVRSIALICFSNWMSSCWFS